MSIFERFLDLFWTFFLKIYRRLVFKGLCQHLTPVRPWFYKGIFIKKKNNLLQKWKKGKWLKKCYSWSMVIKVWRTKTEMSFERENSWVFIIKSSCPVSTAHIFLYFPVFFSCMFVFVIGTGFSCSLQMGCTCYQGEKKTPWGIC